VRFLADPFYRLFPLALVSSFYTFCVSGGIINGSLSADYAAAYAPLYYVVLWAGHDSRRSGYWPFYHYGLWMLIFGIILVPQYTIKTRGFRGVGLAIILSLVIWAPTAAGIAGWWLSEKLPDFR